MAGLCQLEGSRGNNGPCEGYAPTATKILSGAGGLHVFPRQDEAHDSQGMMKLIIRKPGHPCLVGRNCTAADQDSQKRWLDCVKLPVMMLAAIRKEAAPAKTARPTVGEKTQGRPSP